MTQPHTHELAATKMMRVLDYDTISMGCHTCGTQWIITINWVDRTFQISWVNVPWRLYYDARSNRLDVTSEALDDDA